MNLIHIASDEKFINSAYWQFHQAFPNQNIFYLLVNDPNQKLKYVSLTDHFQLVPNRVKEIRKLARSFKKGDIICFHGLDYFRSVLLNSLPKGCKIVWFLWGMEVYSNTSLFSSKEVLGSLTASKFTPVTLKQKAIRYFKDNFRRVYYRLQKQTDSPQIETIKAMKRADYLGVLYQEEFNYIKTKVNDDLKFLKFSYYPIELMVDDAEARVHSNNILIGNSASETNNHLEVFDLLKKAPIKENKLIVPLSYGKPEYRDVIIENGRGFFGPSFHPLVDFMPLHEYNTYLKQCGIVIMSHYRQQALGNVLTMLWMGAKVYLDERNTIYHYLLRIGIKISSIQNGLNKDNKNVFTLLSREEQNANRLILKAEVGHEFLVKELRCQFLAIADEH